MDTNQRFDRLEAKVDKLADAITTLTRIEEQIINIHRRAEEQSDMIHKNARDINNLDK